jgi:xanthine dehydrogenase molybdopterin-binding subunit B
MRVTGFTVKAHRFIHAVQRRAQSAIAGLIAIIEAAALMRTTFDRRGVPLLHGALIIIAVFTGWWALDRLPHRDLSDEQHAFETRVFELATRALMPGSPLACLDAIAGDVVKDACEKAIFASPQTTAAAVSYIAAELSLLASASDRVRSTAADTSKVPNASATAASSGSDLNGKAALAAARTIRERLVAFAAKHFAVPAADVELVGNRVRAGGHDLPLGEFLQLAYRARVALGASGFYATPKIHYDRKTFSGRPFFYFAYGAAVSEVMIDTLTGENRVLAVDILYDVGASLNPAIDRGQIEGGFLQGTGWLTSEELVWNDAGELMTHSPSTYKIPACRDWPERFDVEFYGEANREPTIHRSKAVGEPPLMLAISVWLAIRDAISSLVDYRRAPALDAPATPERVLAAIEEIRGRAKG